MRYLARLARLIRNRRSVILCYHGVGRTDIRLDPGFLRIRTDVFRTQLDLLLDAGFEFLTVVELARRAAGREPPPGLAALTFDDGMDDNHEVVLPLLNELGVPATVYVTTGLIGKPNPWLAREAGARMMTHAELADLAAAGFEIGAHSVTHSDLSALDYDACVREMSDSRAALEESLQTKVQTFAYPYCRYGPAAIAAVRACGYSAAVTCHGRGSWDRYELQRSMITGKDSLPAFVAKLTDAYQPLFDSHLGRFARAATRGLRDSRRARRYAEQGGSGDVDGR
jgi:peptidoglycan/xylan/chitin deacetylase (PgdA/CDA1 family)